MDAYIITLIILNILTLIMMSINVVLVYLIRMQQIEITKVLMQNGDD